MVNNSNAGNWSLDSANWMLIRIDPIAGNDTVWSDKAITVGHEQLIPDWGISVEIEQVFYEVRGSDFATELLEATIEYGDSSIQWLSGVPDAEGESNQNWIRSGNLDPDDNADGNGCDADFYRDYLGTDDDEEYEGILGGTWAPYKMCGVGTQGNSNYPCVLNMPIAQAYSGTRILDLADLQSVDIVFTPDQSKWTRCPVIEMEDDPNLAEGGAGKQELRESASVDVNGNPDGTGDGMGWFPGYAIDLETGERLNMAFAEDSWLGVDNGRDMKWNPTSTLYAGFGNSIFGGKHYVYVFKNEQKDNGAGSDRMPSYDQGAWMYSKLTSGSSGQKTKVWRSCIWVGMPMLDPLYDFDDPTEIPTTARIRLRVAKKYDLYATQGDLADSLTLSSNNWNPVYEFNTDNVAVVTMDHDTALSALDLVNVVPNPYYGYSGYEENRIDNRVKFTNLPEQCTITIYTAAGTMVRQFTKDDPLTYFDWDLKNLKGIPVASGTYIIHIKADNLPTTDGGDMKKRANERVIKWFGVLRPPDLDNF